MKKGLFIICFLTFINVFLYSADNQRCDFKNLRFYLQKNKSYIPLQTFDEIIVPKDMLLVEDFEKITDEDYQYLVSYYYDNYISTRKRIYIITSDDLGIVKNSSGYNIINKKIKIRLTNIDAEYKVGNEIYSCLVFDTVPFDPNAHDFPVYYFDKNECLFSILVGHLGKTENEIRLLYPNAVKVSSNTLVLTDSDSLQNNNLFPGFQWTITNGIITKANYRLYDNSVYDEQVEKTIELYGKPEYTNEVMREWNFNGIHIFYNGSKDSDCILYFASYQ